MQSFKEQQGEIRKQSDQCKEIEGNSRMGNIRDLLNKIRYIKEIFIQRWAQKKDGNGMDLTEAEDINKRWPEYTEELYKKRSS